MHSTRPGRHPAGRDELVPLVRDCYHRALASANDARQRALARAGRVRYDVAARRALSGRSRWYSRWYRPPRRIEPFVAAVYRALREDPEYTGAVSEMVVYLDAAMVQARARGQERDRALRWLLHQLVLLLRPLMGERAATERVAQLVYRRSGPRAIPPPRSFAPDRNDQRQDG